MPQNGDAIDQAYLCCWTKGPIRPMRCHYEVLEVSRDADDDAIKKAYRKAALTWHPDKNPDRREEANERFQEVVNAWEVLSDKHERAWYDSHRSAILRSGETHQAGGGSGAAAGGRPEDEIDPFQFFTPSCFSGYSDGSRGFYTVYSRVFSKVAAEEAQAREAEGSLRDDTAPTFGMAQTAGPEVSRFYSYWMDFCTSKTFAWADKWHPGTAQNRKVRRLMEEDNRKARKAARKAYNEAVRELAAFVRKRDKRMAAWQAELARQQQQREAQEKARRQAEQAERWARAEALREEERLAAEEASSCEDGASATSGASGGQPAEEQMQDAFYCVLCDKQFKSAHALANHERSKKHAEAFEALRKVLEEEEALQAQGDGKDESATSAEETDGTEAPAAADLSGLEVEVGSPLQQAPALSRSKKKQRKKAKQWAKFAGTSADREPSDSESSTVCNDGGERIMANGEAMEADSSSKEMAGEELSEEELLQHMMAASSLNNWADVQELGENLHSAEAEALPVAEAPQSAGQQQTTDSTSGEAPTQTQAKKKPGRGKVKKKTSAKGLEGTPQASATACMVCGAECSTRNRLFKHIKDTGHAALK